MTSMSEAIRTIAYKVCHRSGFQASSDIRMYSMAQHADPHSAPTEHTSNMASVRHAGPYRLMRRHCLRQLVR